MTRRRSRNAGFTLPELLIGIVLMAIFGLALLGFYTSSLNQATTHESQAKTQADGRTALDRLESEIRQSISPDAGITPPIASLTATSIVFYYDGTRDPTDLSTFPQRVRYQVVSGQLLRDVANPVGAAPPYTWTGYGPQEVLATGVQTAVPLFAAEDDSGAALAASLTAPATASIALVHMRLVLAYRTGQSNSTLELSTDVAPRNPRVN
ncbi:MAG: type II secretion system protein [Thermoleophilia bacterium]